MNIWHIAGFSCLQYQCPIKPRSGERPRFWKGSPTHKGPFAHARDIIVPDPQVRSLPVFAPQDGVIVELKQNHTAWGRTSGYALFTNVISVLTLVPREFYQFCHIMAFSCPYKIGDRVKAGELLAQTGANGYMTDTRHIHFMVGVIDEKGPEGFSSVRIRWANTPA